MTILKEAAVTTGTIDTDVHIAPSSIEELFPYLSEYWREYFEDAETDLKPQVGTSYPPNMESSGGIPPANMEDLRAKYLEPIQPSAAVLNCVSVFNANRNPYCHAAVARATNDWIMHEWLDKDATLRGSMVVPTVDIKASVAEIDRVAKEGNGRFVQVLLPIRGQDLRYGHVQYRDLFAAAEEHDLVVGLHAWGRRGSAPMTGGIPHTYIDDYLLNSQMSVQEQLVSMVSEGLFEDLPDLRVALLECGFSWLPSLMMRFQKDWKAVWREVPWLKNEPAYYVYRHFRATTEPVQLPDDPIQLRQILDQIRPAEFLMHASDFPHNHGGGQERLYGALTDLEKNAVLRGNAEAFYRLEV